MAMVWKADLPSTAKLVLLRLADFASDDGGRIFPAVSTIAAECGLGERTVQDQLRALEARGVLCLVREAVCATRRPREYRIDLSTLEALKRVEKKKKTRQPGADTAPGAGTAPDADTAPGATGAPVPRDSRTSPVQVPHQSPAAAAPNPPVYPSENPSGEPSAATDVADANAHARHEPMTNHLAAEITSLRADLDMGLHRFSVLTGISTGRLQKIEKGTQRLDTSEIQKLLATLASLRNKLYHGSSAPDCLTKAIQRYCSLPGCDMSRLGMSLSLRSGELREIIGDKRLSNEERGQLSARVNAAAELAQRTPPARTVSSECMPLWQIDLLRGK